jgi:hypothetical protein
MVFTFIVEYLTNFGENIDFVLIKDDEISVFPMNYEANGQWQITLNIDDANSSYYYQLSKNGISNKEWGLRYFCF